MTAVLIAAVALVIPALAQSSVEDFYKGKQINLIVGYGPGGGYDVAARLLGRYLGRYVAGNPNIVVQNMPGAGSLRATNYLYSVAPKDGTTIGLFGSDMPLIGLIANNPNVQFDPRRFIWLGSSSSFVAVERGEVDGRMFDFSSVKSNKPQWLKPDSGFHLLLQFARITRHAELPEVPTARELAPNADARALIELAETPLLTMARPFAAPPGVPDERARALRAAFLAAHRDAELRAEAARLGIDISPVGAEDMVRSIEQMTRTSPEAFDYMKRLLASHKGN